MLTEIIIIGDELVSGKTRDLNGWYASGRLLSSGLEVSEIRAVGDKALRAGANVHIMTSALDIAYDIFVPTLKHRRFKTAIFCVCPYSVHPMALPLLICGIEGFVVQFNSGYCVDYSQWSLADGGTKNERTFLSQPAYRKILAFLDNVAALRVELKKPSYHCFQEEGNIYAPG